MEWEEQLKMIRKKLQKKGFSFRLLVSVSVSLALREANDIVEALWVVLTREVRVESHPAGFSSTRQNTAGRGQIHAFMFLRHTNGWGVYLICDVSQVVDELNHSQHEQTQILPAVRKP